MASTMSAKVGGAIAEVTREQPDLGAVLLGEDADAIVLLLVYPAWPMKRRVGQRGEHGRAGRG